MSFLPRKGGRPETNKTAIANRLARIRQAESRPHQISCMLRIGVSWALARTLARCSPKRSGRYYDRNEFEDQFLIKFKAPFFERFLTCEGLTDNLIPYKRIKFINVWLQKMVRRWKS